MLPWQLHPLRYLPLLSLAPFKSSQSLSVYFWNKVPYSSLHRLSFIFSSQASPSVFLFSRFPVCSNCLSVLQDYPHCLILQAFFLENTIYTSLCGVCMALCNKENRRAPSYLGSPSAKTKEGPHSTYNEQTNKINCEHHREQARIHFEEETLLSQNHRQNVPRILLTDYFSFGQSMEWVPVFWDMLVKKKNHKKIPSKWEFSSSYLIIKL